MPFSHTCVVHCQLVEVQTMALLASTRMVVTSETIHSVEHCNSMKWPVSIIQGPCGVIWFMP